MPISFWKLKKDCVDIPLNITVELPMPKKKPSKIKVILFSIKWHWKNRKWKNCRHKWRAFKRALKKEF